MLSADWASSKDSLLVCLGIVEGLVVLLVESFEELEARSITWSLYIRLQKYGSERIEQVVQVFGKYKLLGWLLYVTAKLATSDYVPARWNCGAVS